VTALAIVILSAACSHSSAATQPKTITPAERQARWHNMQRALETYNNVVQSTRDDFKYCELLSGTNANQCFATTLQPLHASLVQVNIAMQALVEGATSTGTCVSYLHETIKRGNAVANGYKKVIQALSERRRQSRRSAT
jgi:hypothetical protein